MDLEAAAAASDDGEEEAGEEVSGTPISWGFRVGRGRAAWRRVRGGQAHEHKQSR